MTAHEITELIKLAICLGVGVLVFLLLTDRRV